MGKDKKDKKKKEKKEKKKKEHKKDKKRKDRSSSDGSDSSSDSNAEYSMITGRKIKRKIDKTVLSPLLPSSTAPHVCSAADVRQGGGGAKGCLSGEYQCRW